MSPSHDTALPSVAQLAESIRKLTPDERRELFNTMALLVIEDTDRPVIVIRSKEGQVIRVLVHPSKLRTIETEEERALRRQAQEQLAAIGDDLAALDWLTAEEVLERFRSGTLHDRLAE